MEILGHAYEEVSGLWWENLQHHPMAWCPGLEKERESGQSTSIHLSLLPDSGSNVTTCLMPL